ncbi:folylpolyglutamate synthase [Clostridium botulinum]|uniref:tetrahydrofolate synthase n=1 Tax=Clostridium botulinum TaxID=1491 RepID=A0A9Q1UYN9_CLOBO|nr:folylpolyglutamate synthase/dihydrofolate synthase family protein [Clostridium botulinum]KEH99547.1 folylpolyglutamate synthase [Clostridium botulinum D str. 16868]KEI04322.1 folylpolyglutamate synthase [Clostridium botulinum C/D str. Sp77]KOA76578.1 folylpolyglutamate synthase [Clostridium botulinum]KOA83782.1 folylpolyglutamate synthase [Clostridium botulinum]KOA84068.1 folylpolyglutamate synthase [Clostridium botulinum]
MNYKEAMNYIEDSAKFSIKLGLSRTERILEILGNPHKKIKYIHIAGTNGKGSITAMLSSVLIEEGYKVGMYTSPYIEEFEERIQINNTKISKEDLAYEITKVYNAANQIIKEGYSHPTQFEIITCASLLYFFEKNVDYAVMEVGLGGRLDSTNVIKPILSVISSISYDHMKILGSTLEKIAYEKAGIIKDEVPVVLYPQQENVENVIKDVCKDKRSELIKVPSDCAEFLICTDKILNKGERRVQNIIINTKNQRYNINLSLLGKHQLLNCATVIYAIEKLRNLGVLISDTSITQGLLKVKWMGRFEILKKNPLVVIDGAHNIDGIKKLKESINLYLEYKNVILILGILTDKQVENMVEVITPMADKVICVTPHSDRAEIATELMKIVKKYNEDCEAVESYEDAYMNALKYCEEDDLLLVSGSLYMIGDMRKIIIKK